MADEAVVIELANENPVQRTIADGVSGTDILKNTLMALDTDPNTVTASAAAEQFGGILAFDKEGGDGSTLTSCHMDGVYDLTCNANAGVTLGGWVSLSGANLIKAATAAEILSGGVVGKAEETFAASEVGRVRLIGS